DGESLNYLIRPRQQRRRDGQAEGLGGLEVDDQLELGGLLDGEVGGLGTLEDLVDKRCGAAIQTGCTVPVGHEAPSVWKQGIKLSGWGQLPLQGKPTDLTRRDRYVVRAVEQQAICAGLELRERLRDTGRVAQSNKLHLHLGRLRVKWRPSFAEGSTGGSGVVE